MSPVTASKGRRWTPSHRKRKVNYTKKIKLTIAGNVQDVGFRLRLLSEAQRLSLSGFFAANLPDKRTVVVYAGGNAKAVTEFVRCVRIMKCDHSGIVKVVVERYGEDIRNIGDYVDYLHTEQLSKGVEAVQTLGEALKEVAHDFANSVASGFRHMDERFDEMPRRVAGEIGRL